MTTCRSPSSTIVFGGASTRRVPDAKDFEFVDLAEINLLSRGLLRQNGGYCTQQRHNRRDPQPKTYRSVQFSAVRSTLRPAGACGMRSQPRVPENDEVPKSPSTTLPLTSSPLIVPLNSSVIGIGSVIDTFQEISLPLTVPSKISVEFPSAAWLPLKRGAFCLQ